MSDKIGTSLPELDYLIERAPSFEEGPCYRKWNYKSEGMHPWTLDPREGERFTC
jgi:hypothetical protein